MNNLLLQVLLGKLLIHEPNFPITRKSLSLLADIGEDDGEINVFIIYAPCDKYYAEQLKIHLAMFIRFYKVQVHLMPVESNGLTLLQIAEIAKYSKSFVYYLETEKVYTSLCDQIDILREVCYKLIPVFLRPVSKHLIELLYELQIDAYIAMSDNQDKLWVEVCLLLKPFIEKRHS